MKHIKYALYVLVAVVVSACGKNDSNNNGSTTNPNLSNYAYANCGGQAGLVQTQYGCMPVAQGQCPTNVQYGFSQQYGCVPVTNAGYGTNGYNNGYNYNQYPGGGGSYGQRTCYGYIPQYGSYGYYYSSTGYCY